MMDITRCVCDTSVIRRLVKDIPDFGEFMTVLIPESAMKMRELRIDQAVWKHINNGAIEMVEFNQRDKTNVATIIRKVLGNKEVATSYLKRKATRDMVEIECAYMAGKMNVPIALFDKKGLPRAKIILRDKDHLVIDIVRFIKAMPIPNEQKMEALGNIGLKTKMGYKKALDEYYRMIERAKKSRKKRKKRKKQGRRR